MVKIYLKGVKLAEERLKMIEICPYKDCQRKFEGKFASKEKEIHIRYFHKADSKSLKISQKACPECGSSLIHQEGCEFCQICGFSRCS